MKRREEREDKKNENERFDQIEGNLQVFCCLANPTITPAKEKKRRNKVKRREEREDKKNENERFVFLHFTLATLKEKT